jgi:sulfur-carrier protein
MTAVRVVLPAHLKSLARVQGEVTLHLGGEHDPATVTRQVLLDALEAAYPVLRGTIRDHVTGKRRALVRFYACQQDLSNEPPDAALPAAVAAGAEPFLIVGAMAGG